MDGSFDWLGPRLPESPVVVSVPHAGRDYPAALTAALRVPASALRALEDRHVDTVALAARQGETMLVQRAPRAWIDLNRGEDERDPAVDDGATAESQPIRSAKLRSGLGLVPRRAGPAGDLWRRRFAAHDIESRIGRDYRPYHAALGDALGAARDRFGTAVLLDLHSMPPLDGDARLVLGDRFGRSAGARFVARAEAAAVAMGAAVALNAPYAGGHILDRHGSPRHGIHAVQVELDRSLYLDGAMDRPGVGFAATVRLVREIINALADEAMGSDTALAAE